MTTTETKLRLALVRLLWNSVADDATCTCCLGDTCPQCEAMTALGDGRWRGAEHAQSKLIRQTTKLMRPAKARRGGKAGAR